MPDSSASVNASRYFTDPDADPLIYTAASSNTDRATVEVSGSTVTVTGQATGSAEITVTATDPDELSATQEFIVAVRTAARSDLLVDPPEADPHEVAPGEEFTLSAVVRNQGGAAASSGTTLRYYRSTDGTIDTGDTEIDTDQVPRLGSAKSSGESLDVTAPSGTGTYYYGACADAVGNESDKGNNCSAAVKVTVTQSNRAPRAAGTIPDVDVLPDSSFTLDAAAYFTDPDSDPLVHTARSSNTARATVAVSGSTVTVTGEATGSAQITVTATDPDKLSATQRFTVTVRATARSDLVVEPPGADPHEVAPGEEFTLSEMVRNQGSGDASSGTMLRYYRSADAGIDTDDTEIDTDNIPKLNASKTSSESLTVTSPSEEGTYYYGACADTIDNESDTNNNCSNAVEVTVAKPNRAPEPVGSISARTVVENWHERMRFDIAGYFTDPDDDKLTYSYSTSDRETASARIDGSRITIYGKAEGTADITVTATDPGGLSAGQSFTVTVLGPRSELWPLSMNALPDSLGPKDPLRLDLWIRNSGNASTSSATTVRFYHSEDDTLDSDDAELTAIEIPEVPYRRDVFVSRDTVAPSDTGVHYYGACIDAVDNEFDTENNCTTGRLRKIRVKVAQRNRGPQLVADIPRDTLEVGDSAQIDLSDYFVDPDGDSLTYLARSWSPGRVSVSLAGSTLTYRGISAFAADISVRAHDPDSVFAFYEFKVCVSLCEIRPSRFYLTQAVQGLGSHTPTATPLVANEKALLRVFVIASMKGDTVIPEVRGTFSSQSGGWTRHVTIPAGSEKIPLEIDQSDLAKSANAEIPASWMRPDVRVYVTIDPNNTLPDSLHVNKRIPKTGSWSVDARTVPTLDLTLVPFLWTEDPDSAVLDWSAGLVSDTTDFAPALYPFTLLPVEEVDGTEHDPVETDNDSLNVLYIMTAAIRVAEDGDGHYMGLISPSAPDYRGIGAAPGWVSVAITSGRVVGHELGHNFSLLHAPACGATSYLDGAYPYPGGKIGKWGYDFRADSLIPPSTRDLLSYCDVRWISDYHFKKALNYRTRAEYRGGSSASPTRSILVWGRVSADGDPHLEPAIAIDAVPSLPTGPGPYRLAGRADDGAELFSFRFDMPEVADGDGGSAFAFAIPVQSAWAGNLADITLFAGALTATLDRDTDRPLVFLRDPVTRQIRGIFRNVKDATRQRIEAAKRRGFEVLTSRGIPDLGK